jgi:DNA-binding transcriptional ArsR family regulator
MRSCEWSGFPVCSAIIDHSALTDYEADDVLVVTEPERLKALASDVRSRIIGLLRERAASITELSQALGLPKGTVGHHVKVLEDAGLIRVVATRQVRAMTERFYGRVARLFILSGDEAIVGGTGEAMAAMMLRQGADEIPKSVASSDLITAALSHARLKPTHARRLIKRLDKLLVDFRALEDPEGELFGFAASLYPTTPALPERSDGA